VLFYLCLTCINSLTEIMSYDWFINLPIRILRRTSCLLIFFLQFYNRTQKQNEYKHPFKCLKLFSFASKCGTSLRQRINFVVVISIFLSFIFFAEKKKERERRKKNTNDDGGGYGYINDDTSWYTLSKPCIFPPFPFPIFINDLSTSSLFFEVIHIRGGECTTKEL